MYCPNQHSPTDTVTPSSALTALRAFCTDPSEFESIISQVVRWFQLDKSLIIVGSHFAEHFMCPGRIVFDETVAGLYPQLSCHRLSTIPSGECHKTPEGLLRLWHDFAQAGIDRDTAVGACGGGVTGDLTGFAAATWMRGIPWITIPTTLLAMVDASVGGKTGCDLPEGKNLAGAFHAPHAVVIDTDFLSTLPKRELRSGYSELIKHFIIGKCPGRPSAAPVIDFSNIPTAAQIADSLEVKIAIVRQDPLDTTGVRLMLNCGHTIGHAVEKASGYGLSHGEAVAIGCVYEAKIAVERKLAAPEWPAELAACFRSAGLPTELPEGVSYHQLKEYIRVDKKNSGGVVTYALPCGWGDVRAVSLPL